MSELKHYLLDVTVTDAVFGSSESIKSDMKVAALGRDEEDVAELVIDFFTRSGLAVREQNGIQTLFRTEAKTGPGAIRTVKVTSIIPYVSPTALPSTAAAAPKTRKKAEKPASVPEPIETETPTEKSQCCELDDDHDGNCPIHPEMPAEAAA